MICELSVWPSVATFDNEIRAWSGLGKSAVREKGRNVIKTGLVVLTSLPISFPVNFPDCGFYESRWVFSLPVSLPRSSRIAAF